MRFRTPELFLGVFLTVAIFSMGLTVSSTLFPPNQSSPYESHGDHPKEKTPKVGDSESADDRIAKYTRWLAVLTGALVLTAVGQGYFLLRADKTARIAANAANLSAKTAVAAELSEIVVGKIDLVKYPDPAPGMPDITFAAGPIPQNDMRALVYLKNSGRTRSRTTEICVEWTVVERASVDRNPDPPPEPTYVNKIATTRIFGSEEVQPLKWSGEVNGVIRLTDDQRRAINENQAWLWIYGFIRYSDFIKDTYQIGFVGHWEALAGSTIGSRSVPSPRGLVLEGPNGYIYRRQIEEKT